jgi:integrase/recombinase XerD
MDYTISLYLDERREKKDNTFPVKLNVFTNYPKKQKLYSTGISVTKQVYELTQNSKNNKNEIREIRDRLIEIRANAIKVAESVKPFDWNIFELKMSRKKGDSQNVYYHIQEKIDSFTKDNKHSSAESYLNTLKSFKKFNNYLNKGKEISELRFEEITYEWLKKYQDYLLKIENKTLGTVGHYTRNLRTVFNSAIHNNEIIPTLYPFYSRIGGIKGKKLYKIPSTSKVKKALSMEEILKIFNYTTKSEAQELARDMWMLMFLCNGINMMDLAYLKFENIEEQKFTFYRKKTKETTINNLELCEVFFNDISLALFKKYENKNKKPKDLVFEFITNNENDESKARLKIKSFTKSINDQIKKIAKEIGITEKISSYWARHSFANTALEVTGDVYYIKTSLNHGTIKITEGYFQGKTEDENKKTSHKVFEFLLNK